MKKISNTEQLFIKYLNILITHYIVQNALVNINKRLQTL